MLKAIGKFIDTLPLKNLLSLEENHADTVIIEVDRVHDTLDLSEFTFIMRGITPSGLESQTELHKELSQDGNSLLLTWHISSLFTTEPGTLFLDLFAYKYNSITGVQNPPDYLLRYQLPPVEIRNIPAKTGDASDEQGYTAFYIEVKEQLRALQDATGEQGTSIRSILFALGDHTTRLAELQGRIDILVMTQEEYNALESPDAHTLYVLT